MEEKYHKNCGGKVVYKQNPENNGNWEKAGECLKCNLFPIDEDEIIFKLDNGKFEKMFENGWKIVNKNELSENLD